MILHKLEMYNFRQYIGLQEISFSTDPEKNVTVLIGVNTSGKTKTHELELNNKENEIKLELKDYYEEEIKRLNDKLNMPICNVLKAGLNEDVAGIVINPFGLALTMPKDVLKIVVDRYDEIKEGESDENDRKS